MTIGPVPVCRWTLVRPGVTAVAIVCAAAMAACHHGGKVLVLTVDPAKRLADALGLSGIGNTERRIDNEVFTKAGYRPTDRYVPGRDPKINRAYTRSLT